LVTILLVGEGAAEQNLLGFLKGLYVPRGSGVRVTIKNAHGKGAGHVVNYAIRQCRNAAYDFKLALLDSDTGWNEETRNLALKEEVQVLLCEPCIEALLLRIHGHAVGGYTSPQLKQRFKQQFGREAHDPRVYDDAFGREVLELARCQIQELDRLIKAFSAQT
jgi:hypothetical protein